MTPARAGGLSASPAPRLLVIGYGNTLRGDDRAGPLVAERITARGLAGVVARTVHQLTPELAPAIAEAGAVVFVDASLRADAVNLRALAPATGKPSLDHASSPEALLALSRELFGRLPQAWLLSVPVEDLALGESLSPRATDGVEVAVRLLEELAEKLAGQ